MTLLPGLDVWGFDFIRIISEVASLRPKSFIETEYNRRNSSTILVMTMFRPERHIP